MMYQTLYLVKIYQNVYVALPHPDDENLLRVDFHKNLTFSKEVKKDSLNIVEEVTAFNRFIPLQLELVPGIPEVSSFELLAKVLAESVNVIADTWEKTPANHTLYLTLIGLYTQLGEALHRELTQKPDREEIAYINHDFITHKIQSRLVQTGWEPPK